MESVVNIPEQFKKLSKEKQADIFIEIQQIFYGMDTEEFTEELMSELDRRQQDFIKDKSKMIPHNVVIGKLNNAI